MIRKRPRNQEFSSRSVNNGTSSAQGGENDDKGSRLQVFWRCFDVRKRSVKMILLFSILVALTIYALIRGYYALELWLDDPFLEAQLITPLTYLRVRYLEAKPSGRPRRFFMQHNNTFVMNLDSDVDRFRTFQTLNKVNAADRDSDSEPFFQRFSAFRWVLSSPKDGSERLRGKRKSSAATDSEQDKIKISIQEDAMSRYPILRYSVQQGRPGNAGCTMSHIQLLEQLSSQNDEQGHGYYFVFEDDAKLSDQLLQHRLVEGPPDADIVILSPTSTKTVRTPYRYGEDGYAIRVVQSYGAFAYVITKSGANKLLRHFRGNHDDPIDVGFHRAQGVCMYHPTNGWPQANHSFVGSTRQAANKG